MKRVIFIGLLLVSQYVRAGWELNNEQSTLAFLSTKNDKVTEVHGFRSMAGSLTDDGAAVLKIDLNSVETGIPVRNDRMRQFLFQTDEYAVAEIKLTTDKLKLDELQVGSVQRVPVQASLNLHGISKELKTSLLVIGLKDSAIYVASVNPIILQVVDFDLLNGLDKLKEIAKLSSIDTSVPVTFNLIFDRK